LFISDQANNVIRKMDTNGIINIVAVQIGPAGFGFSGDGGPATQARFEGPAGIAMDTAGNLYITDYGNIALRVMLANGTMATVAGNGTAGLSGDNGPATAARLDSPRQVAVGTFGEVYIADSLNNVIRKLTPGSATLGHVTNAFGNVPVLAGNTWVAIKGTNLAPPGDSRIWQTSDFINGQMPTSLDGVSVTMNNESAYVYYISPTQVNVLAPPDLQPGVIQVQLTNNGKKSAVGSIILRAYSPSFFVFNGGPYIIAVHTDGSLVGPTSLFPGASTPARPGETIILFGNGFGPVTSPIQAGSSAQSGALPAKPTLTIGDIQATVQFAGLISPGLYQLNIVVPSSAPSGDNVITAAYNGATTQSGVLLAIQP
jgi:uncharacterized protein (TIGR03437 family)